MPTPAERRARPEVPLGRVAAVLRYPVKSMAGESLPHADVDWHGIAGDRRWAFVRHDRQASGFPWLTIRQRPHLWRYRATVVDHARPDRSPVVVRTPTGGEFAVLDPQLAADIGDGTWAMKLDRGTFDVAPLSLLTTRAVASLEAVVGFHLDPLRFRPNLLIDAYDEHRYPEDGWIGRSLRIGEAVIRVDQHDRRCVVVNVDPESTDRDPRVLRAIAQERQSRLAVYVSVQRPGRIAVGDAVALLPDVGHL